MNSRLGIPDPKILLGLFLLVLGGWLALEGAFMKSAGQLALAAALMGCGWWLRKRGMAALTGAGWRRWARFCAAAGPVLLAIYVLGYFALMDRYQPAKTAGGFVRFESSLRWAPREWMNKAARPYETPWSSVTTWNIIYRPMDQLWFHYFPRSPQEWERLRAMGYFNGRKMNAPLSVCRGSSDSFLD